MNKQEAITIMQHSSREGKLSYLYDLDTAFDSYNRNIENSGEVIDVLIDIALTSEDDEITNEILEVICSAQITQELMEADFDKIADNLNNVPIKFLPRYIDILSYTGNKKYSHFIINFKGHPDKYVREAVKDALVELRIADF